jgi:hypothetical protein
MGIVVTMGMNVAGFATAPKRRQCYAPPVEETTCL